MKLPRYFLILSHLPQFHASLKIFQRHHGLTGNSLENDLSFLGFFFLKCWQRLLSSEKMEISQLLQFLELEDTSVFFIVP
jgi:hypothetical protein